MMPRQGFVSGLFGRLTRSLGRGGSGRWVTDWTVTFCGFGTMVGGDGRIGRCAIAVERAAPGGGGLEML
jgi:hypothetical protein